MYRQAEIQARARTSGQSLVATKNRGKRGQEVDGENDEEGRKEVNTDDVKLIESEPPARLW